MVAARAPLIAAFLRWASGLRFRQLFYLTAGLFVMTVLIPDFVPFADEILFGLLALLFASWKKPESEPAESPKQTGRIIEGELLSDERSERDRTDRG